MTRDDWERIVWAALKEWPADYSISSVEHVPDAGLCLATLRDSRSGELFDVTADPGAGDVAMQRSVVDQIIQREHEVSSESFRGGAVEPR